MKALEFIHLGDNWKLTGPIPSSFWGLSNLTKVIFTATNLIGYDATLIGTPCTSQLAGRSPWNCLN